MWRDLTNRYGLFTILVLGACGGQTGTPGRIDESSGGGQRSSGAGSTLAIGGSRASAAEGGDRTVANGGLANGGLANGGFANGGLANGGLANGGLANGGLANGGLANGGLANGGLANGGLANGGLANGGLTGTLDAGVAGQSGAGRGNLGSTCCRHGDCPVGEYCFNPTQNRVFCGTTLPDTGICRKLRSPDCLYSADPCECLSPSGACSAGTFCSSIGYTDPAYGSYACLQIRSVSISADPLLEGAPRPGALGGIAGAAGATSVWRYEPARRCHINADCPMTYPTCYVPAYVTNCEEGPLGYCTRREGSVHCEAGLGFFSDCMLSTLDLPRTCNPADFRADPRCVSCLNP